MKTLEKARLEFRPLTPHILQDLQQIAIVAESTPALENDADEIKRLFPMTYRQSILKMEIGVNKRSLKSLKIGVVFSGGQAPGGHNVICGLYDALATINQGSSLWGFLGGPSGIINGKIKEITASLLENYRNQGGFDLLGSGRTKIESDEQLKAALKTVTELHLDGLVIIGGDDSNTNAAILAEYFLKEKCQTRIIGVPKTIDGDLRNSHVAISFGFDTACKIYAEMIGNIARDARSAQKYTHFIKLMGRSASHIALECALKTHSNLTLIGEELGHTRSSLTGVIQQIADMIQARATQGKNYSVILIPEGLIEYIPEIKTLIADLNQALAKDKSSSEATVLPLLPTESQNAYKLLPEKIRNQLLMERDPHGNVQVSLIETEKLLIELTSHELKEREKKGLYNGKFSPIAHFLGYEGRSGLPSNFDSNYCYALGYTAALLLDEGVTGYMTTVQDLCETPDRWVLGGMPIAPLLHMEERAGKRKPVIRKALVNLQGNAFQIFAKMRNRWLLEDEYVYPGPMQFFGDPELTDTVPLSIVLEKDIPHN